MRGWGRWLGVGLLCGWIGCGGSAPRLSPEGKTPEEAVADEETQSYEEAIERLCELAEPDATTPTAATPGAEPDKGKPQVEGAPDSEGGELPPPEPLTPIRNRRARMALLTLSQIEDVGRRAARLREIARKARLTHCRLADYYERKATEPAASRAAAGSETKASQGPGSSASRPTLLEVTGPLPERLVQRVLKAHRLQVQACGNRATESGSTPSGSVTLKLQISAEGFVESAEVAESTLATGEESEATLGCLVQASRGWRFPSARSSTEIQQTIRFE